jgi:Tfp pilus assembly protein PilF
LDHSNIASTLNALATVLQDSGDYAGARPLYERALAIWEQALGPQHPNTAQSLNNLAGLLLHQGDVETARQHHERALAIREATLGPNHPNTAQSLWWLGTMLLQANDRDGARERLVRAVNIYIQTLGAQHPTTQQCQSQLATLDAPAPSATQQIADITAHFEAAVAQALADPTIDRIALAAQSEERAGWAEDGEPSCSPYLALAVHLRALAAQLTASPDDEPATNSA